MVVIAETAIGDDYGLGPDYFPTGTWTSMDFREGAILFYMMGAHGQFGYWTIIRTAMLLALGDRVTACTGTELSSLSVTETLRLHTDADLVYSALSGTSTDSVVAQRLFILILYALIFPGYRIYNNVTGRLEWLCGPPTSDDSDNSYGAHIFKEESAIRTMFQQFANGVSRPYDILLLATYRYRESTYSVRDIGMHDGTNIWSPPRATSAGDMLGNSASAGLSPNLIAPTHVRERIIVNDPASADIYNGPIMGDLVSAFGQNPSPAESKLLCYRWVSALMSDQPWIDYEIAGPSTSSGYAYNIFDPSKYPQFAIGDAFEAWFDQRLGLIPTFRQVLTAAAGFTF